MLEGATFPALVRRALGLAILAALSTACGAAEPLADVVSVEATGEPGAYTFEVGISSPDTGCDRYADWWEVLSEDGGLLYRRVLTHSHVDEQPFVRPGGPVEVATDQLVWVRAHMHPGGYGGRAAKGSVAGGFELVDLEAGFASAAAAQEPLPRGCRF